MEACKLCGALVTAPDDAVLDAGRDARSFAALSQQIGVHIQRYHPEVFARLAPVFIDFQRLFYGFFLREHEGEAEVEAWRKGRGELHGRFRSMLALDDPVAVKLVQSAAAGGNGKAGLQ